MSAVDGTANEVSLTELVKGLDEAETTEAYRANLMTLARRVFAKDSPYHGSSSTRLSFAVLESQKVAVEEGAWIANLMLWR